MKRLIISVLAVLPILGHSEARAAGAGAPPRMMGGRPDFTTSDLPEGRFRSRLERLPLAARERAIESLRRFPFPPEDVQSLQADSEGDVFYACEFPAAPMGTDPVSGDPPPASGAAVPVSPFPGGLIFHSRPGSTNVIFLDFDGATVSGTAWNSSLGRATIPAVAFSSDADFTTFSDSEQQAIKRIWQRVAEDFAPFDVDVTTEAPAVMHNRVAHALITRNTDANGAANPSSSAGGVAYVNMFAASNFGYYRPAWIYNNNLGNSESYIAEAASHECGHNLGLSHDGQSGVTEYYNGHGSGATSWAPIMGVGYDKNVTQWSRGEYYLANNTEDDLAIIASKLGYRADDAGESAATLGYLQFTGTNIVFTDPETDPDNLNPANKGVIERNGDGDRFAFVAGAGPLRIAARPWLSPGGTRGGNLDVVLRLLNESGAVLVESNGVAATDALLTAVVPAGVYHLHISASGVGTPTASPPSGYTDYASLGQYFLSGWVTDPNGLALPPQAALSTDPIGQVGKTQHLVRVTYSDNAAIQVSTLDDQDIRVTGPNGFTRAASLVAVDDPGDGSPRTATYRVTPPNFSAWRPADNGVYDVWMESNQVRDIEGEYVAAQRLGSFTCAVPTVIYEADMSTNPGWTLGGAWAYGQPTGKGGDPAGGFTGPNVVGYSLTGTYARSFSAAYAVTPTISCANAATVKLDFQRWLGVRSGDAATIQISTNGSTWLNLWSASGDVADTAWTNIQFDVTALAAGQSAVRFRWGLSGNGDSRTSFGWNLDDVRVLAGGVAAVSHPLVVAASPAAWGSVIPDGGAYEAGSQVEVTAVPEPYFEFVEWQGDLSGSANPATLLMTRGRSVTAVFREQLTTNSPTPIWWLAGQGYAPDFEEAVVSDGANGLPVWASYVAGLDPHNPTSRFELTVSPADAGERLWRIAWPTVSGRVYSVLQTTDLGTGPTPAPGADNLPWTQSSFTGRLDQSQGFFGVRVRLAP